ncbi:MAG: histidine phosphatase family protein [Micropruina sp.]|uniref:histidine phosphatase family protein n=1 Tax=Micropruina sp. TaxID=2737536 RepID=UPI0039E6BF9B
MRLTLLAHGETVGARHGVFGAAGDLLAAPEPPVLRRGGRGQVVCGPEPACAQTAALLAGPDSEPLAGDGLAGPDFGSWAGRSAAEIAESDPDGLRQWLTDPDCAPHGGESLAAQLTRIGAVLDAAGWPSGTLLVVSPLTVRAACVHGLGAPAAVLLRLDVGPLTRAMLSRARDSWRLQALIPAPAPGSTIVGGLA